ncbi:MAG: hypothetical protein HZB23_03575 [Deltaproteobacteria bacterium]|nr:hypothetical protein [Deltaproteobacteria bacterium]
MSNPAPGTGVTGDIENLLLGALVPDCGVQIRSQPEDSSFLLVRAKDALGRGRVFENRAEPPATGEFEAEVLWEDDEEATSGAFSTGPDGSAIYANGREICIWNGPDMKVAACFLLTDVTVTASDISFASSGDTIASATVDFWAAGFRPGVRITISGSASNNNTVTVLSISGTGNKTLAVLEDVIVTESAGAAVTITALPYENRENGVLDVTEAVNNNLKTTGNTMQLGGGNDAYTKCLLHFDGSHGATSTTDSSASAHPVTFSGNAKLTTVDKKFGASSLALDGAGDYVSMADSADWHLGTGPFSIDFWVNFNVLPGAYPNGAFVFEQRVDALNSFSLLLRNNFLTFWIGNGSYLSANTAHFAEGFSTGRWYHLAFCRDSTGKWYLFVDGKTVFAVWPGGIVNIPDFAAPLEIGRGAGGGSTYLYVNGRIDEFRWSKGVCRWTADFTLPVNQYMTPSKSFLAFSTRPIKGARALLSASNNETGASVAVSAWNGNTMAALDVTDGSSGFSVDRGAISFPSTCGMARPMNFGGLFLYAYLFSLSAGSAEICRLTLDAPFQKLGDVWDGVNRTAIAFHVYTGSADKDYTLEVAEASSALYPIAADLSALATSGYVTVIFEERMAGLVFSMIAGSTNASTARPTVSFLGPAGWVGLGAPRDGTMLGASMNWVSLGQSGVMAWNPPNETEESPASLFGVNGYAYRIAFSAALSADVKIDSCFGIPAGKAPRACDFPSAYGGRLLLCGYSEGGEGGRVDYSAPSAPEVNNGELSSDGGKQALYFGGNEPLVAGIEMFNRFGNDVHSFWLGLKKTETFILTGSNPDDFAVRLVSGSIGCVSAKALCAAEMGFEVNQGLGRNVAFWLSASGPVVFDGAVLTPLGGLERFFDEDSSDFVNPDDLDCAVMFYDSAHGELNLLLPLNDSTEPDFWAVFDLKKRAWFAKNPGEGNFPVCAVPVSSRGGVRFVYGGRRYGHVLRLEHGPTWDGTAITCELETGDLLLAGAWNRALVSKFRLWGHLLSEPANAALGVAPDCGDAFTSLGTVALNAGAGRLFRKTVSINAQGWAVRFRIAAVTSASAPGLWLEGLGLEYKVEREDS